GDSATGTRRKLTDQQEREVTRLYSETETPVSEISKTFGIGESSVYRVAQRHGAKLRGRTATSGATGGARRGRRPAASTTSAASTGTTGARRGRRPRAATAAASGASTAASGEAATPRRRGRRPGSASATPAAAAATPRRRGRRPGSATGATAAAS